MASHHLLCYRDSCKCDTCMLLGIFQNSEIQQEELHLWKKPDACLGLRVTAIHVCLSVSWPFCEIPWPASDSYWEYVGQKTLYSLGNFLRYDDRSQLASQNPSQVISHFFSYIQDYSSERHIKSKTKIKSQPQKTHILRTKLNKLSSYHLKLQEAQQQESSSILLKEWPLTTTPLM